MTAPSVDAVRVALDRVVDPCSVSVGVPLGVVGMGLIEDLAVHADGHVVVRLRLTSPGCLMGPLVFEREIAQVVGALPGVTSVAVEPGDSLTWTEDAISPEGRRRLAEARRRRSAAGGVADRRVAG